MSEYRVTGSAYGDLVNYLHYQFPATIGHLTINDMVDALEIDHTHLKSELEKWKLGCETNADCYRESVRKQDEQRLEIIGLKDRLHASEQRVKELVEWGKTLATAAQDKIDYDQENQCPVCHCCGVELDGRGKGHRSD